MQIKVAIVEDEIAFRSLLKTLFALSEDARVVACYGNGQEALMNLSQAKPEVVLIDTTLPSLGAVDLVRRIKTNLPGLRIILLTRIVQETELLEGLSAGADGYLAMSSFTNDPHRVLRAVLSGHVVLSPEAVTILVRQFQRLAVASHRGQQLTRRERQIMNLLATGASNKDIAGVLYVSTATVHLHLHHIYKKLGVPSRTAAVACYLGSRARGGGATTRQPYKAYPAPIFSLRAHACQSRLAARGSALLRFSAVRLRV
jgi:DNA-binding NarL/FixJ family response regulator